jgi:carbon-monoxide dehydrogenase medium subunit
LVLIGLRSRKHIAPFDVLRPTSIGECLLYLSGGERIALMAGGLDLIDRMKAGEVFDTLVVLSGIPELKGIRDNGDSVTVGALTTHATFAENTIVAEKLPDIAKLWREIANPRVRQTGTIGGNLVSALPHYDAMPALLALGATATIADATSGLRTVSLNELPVGEMLLVNVGIPASSMRLVADRSLHPHVSVYAGAKIASGNVTDLRVAIGGAYARSRVVTVPTEELSQSSLGTRAATIARTVVEALPEPLTDGFASSRYRLRMIEVLTRRLLVRLGA